MNGCEISALGLTFKNPIVAASTDIARSVEQFEAFAKSGVGAIITKSVTDAPALQDDNISRIHITDLAQKPVRGAVPEQYTFFSRGGSMVGMEAFEPKAAGMLRIAQKYGTVAIGSIAAGPVENWVRFAKRFEELGFPALELNFGNPHGEASDAKLGFLIGQSPELCEEILKAVQSAVTLPVIVKMTPQLSDVTGMAKHLEACGAKAVTVMHRFQGLMVDSETDAPVLGGWAAIGGSWMKPIALANIARIYRGTGLTIFGGNGANTARDVYEYMCCGASLVEIGSAFMLRGPGYASQVAAEFAALLKEKGLQNCGEITGRTAKQMVSYKNLGALPKRKAAYDLTKCADCSEKPCVETCYFGALHIENGTLVPDSQKCSGCSLCQTRCGRNAVCMQMI